MPGTIQEIIAAAVRTRREALGLSQQDLAEAVGFGSHQIVSDLERGRRDVKAWELARIAEVLHARLPELMGLDAGGQARTPVFWRMGTPTVGRPRHEARLLERLDRYRRVEELLGVAGQADVLPEYPIDFGTVSFSQVQRIASQTRRIMDLGGRPAVALLGTLEERFGVKVFFDDLGDGESAACVREPAGSAILMNRSEAPWRQRFSFAHELFHLVTWSSAMASWPAQDAEPAWSDRVEKLANAFAAALLLPGDDIREEYQGRFGGRAPSDADFVDMARRYGVSTEALLWRLKSLGLLTEEFVRAKLESAEFRRIDRSSMVGHWQEAPPPLPDRFVRLVALAYQAGDLSRSAAAKYLEKNPAELYYLDLDEGNGAAAPASPA
jgi:Zn-dependent peptidase ImmA (M78 family)/DNA-binding XRE family transcriptional regulator